MSFILKIGVSLFRSVNSFIKTDAATQQIKKNPLKIDPKDLAEYMKIEEVDRLEKEKAIKAFAKKQGLDPQKVIETTKLEEKHQIILKGGMHYYRAGEIMKDFLKGKKAD